MKKFIFFALLILLSSFTLTAQTIYVNASASGNNDGTSWADAYTNLQTALDNAGASDIWIATGTYSTSAVGSDTMAVYAVRSATNLYGGFSGTESSLDDRDITANPTILSGDINGDDVAGDLENNRSDNSFHVLYIDSLLTGPIVIDGLTFSGGQTSATDNSVLFNRAGGGIIGLSPVLVRQCTFTNNFGRSGGGIYLLMDANGSVIEDCLFEGNASNSQSAGIMFNTLSNTQVNNCVFTNNQTNRGVIYPLFSDNVMVSDCEFIENSNIDGFSAGIFNWQPTNFKISGCTFTDNDALNGGAIFVNASQVASMNPQNYIIENCTFSGNRATDFGGGSLYIFSASMNIEDCTFEEANIPGSGGFCFFTGDNKVIDIKNTAFRDCSINGWGAAHTCYGENSIFNVSNCSYIDNSALNLGGAINAGFLAVVNIDSCYFESNTGGNGGAVSSQNDSTEVHITNSEFISNAAGGGSGGALSAANGSVIWSVNNCRFEANTADFGGAIHFSEAGDDDIGALELHNSSFIFNLADSQAGAVNIVDADVNISNCVFANNIATDPGTGGAISTNANNGNDVAVSIINSTFYENEGDLAAGIAQWMETDTGSLVLTLQNNIFQNASDNYAIEDGNPSVVSNGGNLDHNSSMSEVLTQSTDLFDVEAMFVGADDFDYHLEAASPAIDAGVAEGAPAFDIEGFARDDMPDIGAYEFDNTSSNQEVLVNNGMLRISPNPIRKTFVFTLENEWTSNLVLQIVDGQGKIVHETKTNKFTPVLEQIINIEKLPTGNYYLVVGNGQEIVIEAFVKQ